MRYLIEYFIKCKKFIGNRVYFLLALMMVAGFMEGISITLFMPILQTGFGDDRLSRLLKTVFGFFNIGYSFGLFLILIMVFFSLRAVFLVLYAHYSGKLTSKLLVTLRRRVVNRVFSAEYIYLLKKEIGFVSNAIIREIAGVVDAFRTFSQVLKFTMLAILYITLSFMLDFGISIIVMVFCPVIILSTLKLNALISRLSLDYSAMHGKYHSVLIQALSNIKYMKATLANLKLVKIIDKENKGLGSIRFKLGFIQTVSKDFFETVIIMFIVGLLFVYRTVLGRGVHGIIFLIFLFLQAARQFLTLQASYRKFLSAKGSVETFNKIEKELEDNKEDLNLGGFEPDFKKDIIFKDVIMTFPNGKKALDSINIRINQKTTVAFVGHSGSGKSTIANMITGILKPTGGALFFGDKDYRMFNLKALRERIGYVMQEDIIFNASIRDNISLWDESIYKDKLVRAIEMAHITGFVNDLPDKQNSMIGDNGLDISGGQRQRITIARELYKDTKLLILDEATSSLDSKSEKQIYENLKEFKGTKTIVVIAHRLSTIKNVDYIYVLNDGRVAEEGTYDDLYRRKGEFKHMIEDQKLV